MHKSKILALLIGSKHDSIRNKNLPDLSERIAKRLTPPSESWCNDLLKCFKLQSVNFDSTKIFDNFPALNKMIEQAQSTSKSWLKIALAKTMNKFKLNPSLKANIVEIVAQSTIDEGKRTIERYHMDDYESKWKKSK